MWQEGNRIHVETRVVETGKTVLSGAYVDLKSVTVSAQSSPSAPPTSTGLLSEKVFAEMKNRLDAKPEVGAKIGAVYQWNITLDKKPAASWSILLFVMIYNGAVLIMVLSS